MYILAYQYGIFKRAVTTSGENDKEIKDGIIADFGDENLTFVKMTQQEFEAWEDSQLKPPPQPTSEQQLTMEMTMAMAQMQMDNMMAIAELTNLIMAMGGM